MDLKIKNLIFGADRGFAGSVRAAGIDKSNIKGKINRSKKIDDFMKHEGLQAFEGCKSLNKKGRPN